MIAKNSPALSEATESLYMLNADDITRQRCQARKEYIIHQNAINQKLEAQDKKIKALSSKYESASAEIKTLSSENERLRTELAKYQA